MSDSATKPLFNTALALAIVCATVSTTAQQATSVVSPVAAPAEAGSDDSPDGIKLHGNWVLDVRNPDGSLVAHSEFKNALTATGQAGMAFLLSGEQPFKTWIVSFNEGYILNGSDILEGLCDSDGLPNGQCRVFDKIGPYASLANGVQRFATMTVSFQSNQVVLTGNFTATHPGGGQIRRVVTHVQMGATTDYVLTLATLPEPVTVAQGQIVQFTYTLSFS